MTPNADHYADLQRNPRQSFHPIEDRRRALAVRVVDLACARLGWARPVAAVIGLLRSGTSWLQQSLAATLRAKTVFEPLSPAIPTYDRLVRGQVLYCDAARHAFMPSLDAPADVAIWRHLDLAFAGYGPGTFGTFALLSREHLLESLWRGVIIKCVRMSVGHVTVQRRYGVPNIHLRRHPCAVVASMLHTRWTWSFEDVRLAELVAALGPDARHVLAPMTPDLDEVVRLHDSDVLSRIATYWALTECYVEARLHAQPWARIVPYELLVANPISTLGELCGFFDAPAHPLVVTGDSPVTQAESVGTPSASRIRAWRKRLIPAAIDRVSGIVSELFPKYELA